MTDWLLSFGYIGKVCKECGHKRSLQDFHNDRRFKKGLHHTCIYCRNLKHDRTKLEELGVYPPKVQRAS